MQYILSLMLFVLGMFSVAEAQAPNPFKEKRHKKAYKKDHVQIRNSIEKYLEYIKKGSLRKKERAVRRIARHGNEAIPYIAPYLKESKTEYHSWIIKTLDRIGTSRAREEIYQYVKQKKKRANTTAIRALGTYRTRKVLILLGKLLQTKKRRIKLATVDALAIFLHTEAVKLLIPLLNDPDILVQIKSKQVLEKLAKRKNINNKIRKLFLQELHNAKAPIQKKQLIEILSNISHNEVVTTLEEILYSADPILYKSAANALGKIGSKSATAILKKQLKQEYQLTNKKILIQSMGYLPAGRYRNSVVPLLILQLKSKNPKIRELTTKTLVKCTGKNFLQNYNGWKFWWLNKVARRSQRMEKFLQDLEHEQAKIYYHALSRLIHKQDIDFLEIKNNKTIVIDLLLDYIEQPKNVKELFLLFRALNSLQVPNIVPILQGFLIDEDIEFRICATKALKYLPAKHSVKMLHQALEEEEETAAIVTIIAILAEFKDKRSFDYFYEMSGDKESKIRAAVTKALRQYKLQKTMELLLDFLKDDAKEVRSAAYNSLVILTNKNIPPDFELWQRYFQSEDYYKDTDLPLTER